jgi:hypothetical protein
LLAFAFGNVAKEQETRAVFVDSGLRGSTLHGKRACPATHEGRFEGTGAARRHQFGESSFEACPMLGVDQVTECSTHELVWRVIAEQADGFRIDIEYYVLAVDHDSVCGCIDEQSKALFRRLKCLRRDSLLGDILKQDGNTLFRIDDEGQEVEAPLPLAGTKEWCVIRFKKRRLACLRLVHGRQERGVTALRRRQFEGYLFELRGTSNSTLASCDSREQGGVCGDAVSAIAQNQDPYRSWIHQ